MYIDKNLLTLTVSHNIFLTRDQRYAFQNDDCELEVSGVSVPVWFYNGKTSEPASEVFCKYKLKISDSKKAITKYSEGYIINLPKKLDDVSMSISDMLRDIKDGGKESVLYKEYSKIKKKSMNYSVIHVVEIYDIEKLTSTII